jgi:hypothetical protein
MKIKAISLMQPFATLIAIGAKGFETRGWSTMHRGRLAIHASARISREFKDLCNLEPFKSVLKAAGYNHWRELPMGCVIATVSVKDCQRIKEWYPASRQAILQSGDKIAGNEFTFGDYTPGRCAWKLSDVAKFREPIPAVGKLSLWEWNDPRITTLDGKPSEI